MNDTIQLKRDVRGVCLCVAGFILTMSIVSIVVVSVALAVELMTDPEFTDIVLEYPDSWINHFDADYLQQRVLDSAGSYSGIASVIGMLCGLPIFFFIRGKKLVTTDITSRNSSPKAGDIVMLFIIILGLQFAMTLIQMALEPLFNSAGGSLVDDLSEGTVQIAASFWGVIYMVVIGPICEELVFRGAVLRRLEKHGANFAIITSSLLFGLYHMILFQAVFAFFIGIVFAYTAGRFSLKWSILLHMLNNLLAVVSIYLQSDIANTVLAAVYFASFIMSIIIFNLNRKTLISAQLAAGAPVSPNTYARAYSSPWLIIYILLCIGSGTTMLGIF